LSHSEKAVISCVGEKSQIQALERSQPVLLRPDVLSVKAMITSVTASLHYLQLRM